MLESKPGTGNKGNYEGSRGLEGLAERKLGVGMKRRVNQVEENHTADENKDREFRTLIHSVTHLFSKHSMSTIIFQIPCHSRKHV